MTPPPARFERLVEVRAAARPVVLLNRAAETVWSVLHALGAHRWRDGYETDLERGWSRYRGSRCAICDVPWEGW